jgi:hypothetical protein
MRWQAYDIPVINFRACDRGKKWRCKTESFWLHLTQEEQKDSRNSPGQFQSFNELLQEGHLRASTYQNQSNRSYFD